MADSREDFNVWQHVSFYTASIHGRPCQSRQPYLNGFSVVRHVYVNDCYVFLENCHVMNLVGEGGKCFMNLTLASQACEDGFRV